MHCPFRQVFSWTRGPALESRIAERSDARPSTRRRADVLGDGHVKVEGNRRRDGLRAARLMARLVLSSLWLGLCVRIAPATARPRRPPAATSRHLLTRELTRLARRERARAKGAAWRRAKDSAGTGRLGRPPRALRHGGSRARSAPHLTIPPRARRPRLRA